jgi:hypothetical protein
MKRPAVDIEATRGIAAGAAPATLDPHHEGEVRRRRDRAPVRAGRITISGKGIVRARTHSSGVGVVKLAVRAKGGARRHLDAIGKARVRAKLLFLAAEGGQARTSRMLVLRKHAPRRP